MENADSRLTKDRLDRVVHDAGNPDGRQNLSQGELVDNGQASVAVEAPPEIASSTPDFLPLPSRKDQPIISDEFEPDAPVQDRRGLAHDGHVEAHSGGHDDRYLSTSLWNPESMDINRGNLVESDHGDDAGPADASMDVGIVDSNDDLRELFSTLLRDEKSEICEADREIMAVVRSLGGNAGKYRRERQRALKHMVAEVYSPPRVTAATKLLPELRIDSWLCVGPHDQGCGWETLGL